MRHNWVWALGLSILLSGCTQMEHKSDQPDKKPLAPLTASVPVIKKWDNSVGNGIGENDIKLLLARSGNRLFTADHLGTIIAVDAVTGKKVWQKTLNAPISAGPAVGDGRIVVGTSNGKIIALDTDNGGVIWNTNTTSEVLAAPKIANDVVYIHTMDGGLSALSLIDGRQLWRYTYNLPPLVLRRASTPAITKDLVVAGFANGKLLAMRTLDGSIEWAHDVAHPKGRSDLQRMVDISADPIVNGDVVYAASYQGKLVALNLGDGHTKWERNLSSFAGFAVDNKMIYLAETNGDVLAVDSTNGTTFWLQNELHGRRLSKPVIMGKYLITADEDGMVHLLELSTGKIVGRYEFDKQGIEATPIVQNNIAYILGRSGKLVALEVN